jgi:ribosomal protein S8
MSKYHAQKTTLDGITFDSLMESRRYACLKLLLAAGAIDALEVHPRYPLVVNDTNIGSYIADFRYRENGKVVVEDTKSDTTRKLPVYRLKRKLMKALHGIDILETSA